jgi:pimeloyl-ACP methyl ester carboxylesterase
MSRYQSIRPSSRSGAIIATAASLAAVAYLVRNSALRAEKRHPPIGKFITVDGASLHYLDTGGAGSAVVLLHGNGATIADWQISGVIDKAKQNYRIIAFDRPGFGYSDRPRGKLWTPDAQADLIQKAVEQIGATRPVVVGHSWGAMVAAALAIRHPGFVRGLVLVSGYYFPSLRADVLFGAPPAIPLLGDVLRYTLSPLLGRVMAPRLIAKMFALREVTPRFTREFPIDLTLRPWQIRASSVETALMIPAAGEMETNYSNIRAPLVIITGADDKIVRPDRQSVRLHGLIHGSKLRVLPDLGHMVHHFASDVIVNAIDTVASGTREGQSASIQE